MGQMLFPSLVPDTELVLYPLQDKLTSGDKSLDLSAFKLSPPILQSLAFRVPVPYASSFFLNIRMRLVQGLEQEEQIEFQVPREFSLIFHISCSRMSLGLGVGIDSNISNTFRLDFVCHSPHVFFSSPPVELC
ncbi:hypothetical protein Tco_0018751 [Tanacetum coccineum]